MFVDIAPPLPLPVIAGDVIPSVGTRGIISPDTSFVNISAGTMPMSFLTQSSRDAFYWALFYANLLLLLLSFTLNLFLTIILAQSTLKNLCCSFYKIMLAFVATNVISSTSDMVCMVFFEGMRYTSTVLCEATLLISLIVSYYMTTVIFLLGLNRFAAFCSPKLSDSIMRSKPLCVLLATLLMFSAVAGVAVYELSGFSRSFDSKEDRIVNTAEDKVLVTVSNYFFYTIPLMSTVFYVICFISLRSQRSLVSTGKTMSLLDKAEKSTLKQGIVILFFYLLSLMIHIFLRYYPPADASYFILSRIETSSSTAPHLAIPLTALVYSKEIRESSWRLIVCHPLRTSLVYAMDNLQRSRSNSSALTRKKSMYA